MSTQRRPDGRVIKHLQFAESVWNPQRRRSDTKIVYNWGRADDPQFIDRLKKLTQSILRRCSPEEVVAEEPGWRVVDAWPHGHIYVLEELWHRLGIAHIVEHIGRRRQFDFSVERALFAMVANRACEPYSKLYCWEQWLREDVRISGTKQLELQHLYRAMDFLEANKESIEEEIYFQVSDLLNLDVDLIFYDTTSLHFEIDEEDEGDGPDETVYGSTAAGAKAYNAPRKRGHSKNGRDDAPQIVVGLAVTRDGLPVRHWVFAGNTVDVSTVWQVKLDLRGWKLGRCVFVGDAGMVSQENLDVLSRGGGKFIVGTPIRRGDEITKKVLSRAGRYKKVAENLRVKEVCIGDGERRRRYVVCHNPEQEAQQRKHRERLLARLEAELASLADCDDGTTHSKRVCELRASRRFGRFLRVDKKGRLVIDKSKVQAEAKLDGKFVVHSNDNTLTAEDMALGYKQLMRVEQAWRSLKSGLRLRPVYHWRPHRISAHVSLTVLALLLEHVAERDCNDTWRNIRDDLRQVKLAQLKGPNGELWQVTEPREGARKRLKSLRIKNPPPVLHAT